MESKVFSPFLVSEGPGQVAARVRDFLEYRSFRRRTPRFIIADFEAFLDGDDSDAAIAIKGRGHSNPAFGPVETVQIPEGGLRVTRRNVYCWKVVVEPPFDGDGRLLGEIVAWLREYYAQPALSPPPITSSAASASDSYPADLDAALLNVIRRDAKITATAVATEMAMTRENFHRDYLTLHGLSMKHLKARARQLAAVREGN